MTKSARKNGAWSDGEPTYGARGGATSMRLGGAPRDGLKMQHEPLAAKTLNENNLKATPQVDYAADPSALSPEVKLHHTFPTPDRTRVACIWEAQSIDRLRAILELIVGRYSSNEFLTVENREGLARPSRVPKVATRQRSEQALIGPPLVGDPVQCA